MGGLCRTNHGAPHQDSHLLVGNAAQLIGKVNPDLSIKVLTSMDLGSNVGMYHCAATSIQHH